MKHAFVFTKIFFLTSISLLLFSCSTGIDEMVTEYNLSFGDNTNISISDYDDTIPSPGDEGFNELNMLRDEYFVRNNALLELAAPYKCSEYKWVLYNLNDEVVEFRIYNGTRNIKEWTTREFNVYLPNSLLKFPITYKLTLTVKGLDNITYTDTAAIVVYEGLDKEEVYY